MDSDRDTGDVANADRGRERGGQRLEVGHVARLRRIVVDTGGHGKAMPQLAKLNEPEP
jgi:hypothetical protein